MKEERERKTWNNKKWSNAKDINTNISSLQKLEREKNYEPQSVCVCFWQCGGLKGGEHAFMEGHGAFSDQLGHKQLRKPFEVV